MLHFDPPAAAAFPPAPAASPAPELHLPRTGGLRRSPAPLCSPLASPPAAEEGRAPALEGDVGAQQPQPQEEEEEPPPQQQQQRAAAGGAAGLVEQLGGLDLSAGGTAAAAARPPSVAREPLRLIGHNNGTGADKAAAATTAAYLKATMHGSTTNAHGQTLNWSNSLQAAAVVSDGLLPGW